VDLFIGPGGFFYLAPECIIVLERPHLGWRDTTAEDPGSQYPIRPLLDREIEIRIQSLHPD
jgi:hypothetical protein